MKKTHAAGYEEYIRRYDDPGAFEELLAAEGSISRASWRS